MKITSIRSNLMHSTPLYHVACKLVFVTYLFFSWFRNFDPKNSVSVSSMGPTEGVPALGSSQSYYMCQNSRRCGTVVKTLDSWVGYAWAQSLTKRSPLLSCRCQKIPLVLSWLVS